MSSSCIMLCLSKRVFFLRFSNKLNGFSLHANSSTNTLARDSLRKLVEYISRGPLSNERLEITMSDQVKLKLKTARSASQSTSSIEDPSESFTTSRNDAYGKGEALTTVKIRVP